MALLVGLIIGAILGLTGAGGSVFAVPLLLILLELPAQDAIGLSLGAVAISALFGTLTRLKSKEIQWLPALTYGVIGSLFSPLGNWLGQYLSDALLLSGFSVLVLLVATRMWVQAKQSPDETKILRARMDSTQSDEVALCRINQNKVFKIGLPCVLGISGGAALTGFLSGLFGVGGGFLIVPTLIFLTGIGIKQAVATSLLIITTISAAGFVSYIGTSAEIDFILLGMLSAGGILGMIFGAAVGKRLAGPILQKLFSVLMVLMAVSTLIFQFAF